MCQTAAAQRRPHCLSKIKQCLVSPPPDSPPPPPPPPSCAQIYACVCTHTHTPPPPAHTLIVPSPESLIKNKLRLLVSKQHSTEVGVWSLRRQSSKGRERASANLINISVSLRLRLEQRLCGEGCSEHTEPNPMLMLYSATGHWRHICDILIRIPLKLQTRTYGCAFYLLCCNEASITMLHCKGKSDTIMMPWLHTKHDYSGLDSYTAMGHWSKVNITCALLSERHFIFFMERGTLAIIT